MAHRRNFERRSASDGFIIGKRVYEVGSEKYLGIAQAQWRAAGRSMLVLEVNHPNPVFIQVDEVLIEARVEKPHLDIDPPPLDQRDKSLIPLDSPHRQKLREKATAEGAEDQVREPGVGDDVEPELPHDKDGVDYSRIPRPTEITQDKIVRPEGSPLGRGRDTGEEDNSARSASIPTGGTMASVSEVKAAIDAANFTAVEAQAAALAAIDKISETIQQYLIALDGSGHDSVSTAKAGMEHAKQQIEEAIQAISGAVEASGQYGAGL